MQNRKYLIAASALAFVPAAFAQDKPVPPPARDPAPPTTPEQVPDKMLICRAKDVLELNLKDRSGKDLGEIGDVLVDTRYGKLSYAIVESGGVAGLGEELRVVPWSKIQISPDKDDAKKCIARTDMTEAQIKAAPTIERGKEIDDKIERAIESVFGKEEHAMLPSSEKRSYVRLEELKGLDVKSASDKEIGEVQELVLAPQQGCIAYVVVDTNKDAGDKDVALPANVLRFAFDSEHKLKASTTLDVAKLRDAPEFKDDDWKRMSSPAFVKEVSTHCGTDPFWKSSVPASAPKAPPKTN